MNIVGNSAHEPAETVTHPRWCIRAVCTAGEGGLHLGRVRLVPMHGPDEGRMLQLDLAQTPGGDPQVRVTPDGRDFTVLSLRSAYLLAEVLRQLSREGRRSER